jgi:hypothetical protein
VSSGPREVYRLSRRGNRRLNHTIHMTAVTQVRHRHSQGRAYYDTMLAESKTRKEALRSFKRQVSNAIFACLQADAQRTAARVKGPGGQQGNDSVSSVAGLHPRHRLFGQATPGPGLHPTTAAASPAPGPAVPPGGAGHSPVAATMPSAKPRVQVERPQPQRPAAQDARIHDTIGKAHRAPCAHRLNPPTSPSAKRTDRTP